MIRETIGDKMHKHHLVSAALLPVDVALSAGVLKFALFDSMVVHDTPHFLQFSIFSCAAGGLRCKYIDRNPFLSAFCPI